MTNMTTETFINQLASGQAADAKETLADLLSARAFEALDARKQELASALFNGQQEEPSGEETPEELTQEEYEQLDELSKDAYQNYLKVSKKEVGKHKSGSQLSRYGYGEINSPNHDRELNTQNAQNYAKKKLGIKTTVKHTPV